MDNNYQWCFGTHEMMTRYNALLRKSAPSKISNYNTDEQLLFLWLRTQPSRAPHLRVLDIDLAGPIRRRQPMKF